MQPQLDRLQDRLLAAGVAPRHVRRFLAELRDHFDDVLRDELAKAGSSAEQAAWARLGNEEHLAQSVLSRPELRSVTARYPWAVFGVAPIVAFLGATFFVQLIVLLLYVLGFDRAADTLQTFSIYALPLPIGYALTALAFRHRAPVAWPVVSNLAVAFCGAFLLVNFGVNQSVFNLDVGLKVNMETQLRAVGMLLAVFAPFYWWRHRHNIHTA
jgi:hypothetical protein